MSTHMNTFVYSCHSKQWIHTPHLSPPMSIKYCAYVTSQWTRYAPETLTKHLSYKAVSSYITLFWFLYSWTLCFCSLMLKRTRFWCTQEDLCHLLILKAVGSNSFHPFNVFNINCCTFVSSHQVTNALRLAWKLLSPPRCHLFPRILHLFSLRSYTSCFWSPWEMLSLPIFFAPQGTHISRGGHGIWRDENLVERILFRNACMAPVETWYLLPI